MNSPVDPVSKAESMGKEDSSVQRDPLEHPREPDEDKSWVAERPLNYHRQVVPVVAFGASVRMDVFSRSEVS